MASLYSELKNGLFLDLCRLITSIEHGQAYHKSDVVKQLCHYPESPDLQEYIQTILIPFYFSFPNGIAINNISGALPITHLSDTELAWLKEMLNDSRYDFLLPEKLKNKLKNYVKFVQNIFPSSHFSIIQETGEDAQQEPLHTHLATFQQALVQQRKVILTGKTEGERRIKTTLSPTHLAYDLVKNEYRFICWDESEKQLYRLCPEQIKELIMTDAPIATTTQDEETQYYQKHQKSVTLRLKRKTNAIERCFSMFFPFDKKAVVSDEELSQYLLTVYYYDFDEDDIINRILSLGSAVTVLDPEPIKQKIISRLKASLSYYQ